MGDFSSSLAISASGLRAQSQRLLHISENISNADTPGYRRKVVPFVVEQGPSGEALVRAGRVRLDPTPAQKIYDPSHPLADAKGYYRGSNVNLMIEIADARQAQRSYEANLKMFEQTRAMSAALLDLLRR